MKRRTLITGGVTAGFIPMLGGETRQTLTQEELDAKRPSGLKQLSPQDILSSFNHASKGWQMWGGRGSKKAPGPHEKFWEFWAEDAWEATGPPELRFLRVEQPSSHTSFKLERLLTAYVYTFKREGHLDARVGVLSDAPGEGEDMFSERWMTARKSLDYLVCRREAADGSTDGVLFDPDDVEKAFRNRLREQPG